MRTLLVVGLLGLAVSAAAVQAGPPAVRLSAVELQPEDPSPGGQFVRLTNVSTRTVGIGCWRLQSSKGTFYVRPTLRIPAGATAQLVPERAWLASEDRITLRAPSGTVVDRTPVLRDGRFDDRIWFLTHGAWRFGRTQVEGKLVNGDLAARKPRGC